MLPLLLECVEREHIEAAPSQVVAPREEWRGLPLGESSFTLLLLLAVLSCVSIGSTTAAAGARESEDSRRKKGAGRALRPRSNRPRSSSTGLTARATAAAAVSTVPAPFLWILFFSDAFSAASTR